MLNYIIFTVDLAFEQYFYLLPYELALAVCHFMCLNHKLPIEIERFWGFERDDRICELCRLNKLGDEYHYLFECTYFEALRRVYHPRDLSRRPNTVFFLNVVNTKDQDSLLVKRRNDNHSPGLLTCVI